MMTFKDFISERAVDNTELANRVSRRYGTRSSFGKWEKVDKGGHIPLSTFNSRKSESAANKLYKVQSHFGFDHKDKDVRAEGRAKYEADHKTQEMPISSLHATQPFVRTNDQDKLHAKIQDRDPKHIHVVTHKGTRYVVDGHHSVMAAHIRGDKTVHVSHIDLDNYK